MDSDVILAVAAGILKTAGLRAVPRSFASVAGGANNRVFKIESGDENFLLKCYFSHPGQMRNRCKSDFDFSQFAWNCGIRTVSKPVGVSNEHHAALYEFITGRRIESGEITAGVLDQAADLFAAINRHRSAADALKIQFAAESCFSIREHLDCIERRINRLRLMDPSQPLGDQAASFIREGLAPKWEQITARITQSDSGESLFYSLPPPMRCLSPSDFGFHNALREEDGRMRFFDFEYAGWDDPAKMLCDFFCQPDVPVPANCFDSFADRALQDFDFRADLIQRAKMLLPVYRIKWCCIMLNEFLPDDRLRRAFSKPENGMVERKKLQLEKMQHALQGIF